MVNPEHQAAVVAELLQATYRAGELNKSEAWLGMIQVMCWYDFGFPHIIDSDKLNPSGLGKKRKGSNVGEAAARYDAPWQVRARAAEAEIERVLGVNAGTAQSLIGRMWRVPLWSDADTGNKKANSVGNALRYLGAHIFQLWGDPRFDYLQEQPLSTYYPGFSIPGVHTPKADILAAEHVGSAPVAIISCKWSMRTDRVSECHKECSAVKSVSHRTQRAVKFYVLCHEYDPSRIVALISDSCIDGVALVNLPLMNALGLDEPLAEEIRRGRILSVEQLIDTTHTW